MKSCSTPAHYYDRNKADKFDVLFGCTSIGDNPTDEHNKYIVIRYDFSKMSMSKDKVNWSLISTFSTPVRQGLRWRRIVTSLAILRSILTAMPRRCCVK